MEKSETKTNKQQSEQTKRTTMRKNERKKAHKNKRRKKCVENYMKRPISLMYSNKLRLVCVNCALFSRLAPPPSEL